MSLFHELKRRNVFKVLVGYVVLGWIVLQVADVLVPALHLPDWTITLLFVLGLLGLPFVIFFSWAFELTPDGIKREEEINPNQSIAAHTGQKLNFVIIILLAVALSYFIWESRFESTTGSTDVAEATEKTVAVLPFVNFSSDEEQAWFADGLTEEILNALVRIRDLKVSSRTSSFSYKGTDKDLRTIARELGVSHILEGSVRRNGDQLRVTAQLIRAEDDVHLWSQTYDRSYDDIINIQEDVAISIAKALKTAMDPEALNNMLSMGTQSVEAYELFMKATVLSRRSNNTRESITLLEEVIELDENFARAYALLGESWLSTMNIATLGNENWMDPAERLKNGLNNIQKAIDLQDDPIELMYLRGIVAASQLRLKEAIRIFENVIEQQPGHVEAHIRLIELLVKTHNYQRAEELLILARKNHVRDMTFHLGQIINYYWTGNYSEAAKAADEATSRLPFDPLIAYQSVRAYTRLKELDKAQQALNVVSGSELPKINITLSRLRFACAEKNFELAEQLYQEGLENTEADLPSVWLLMNLMGKQSDAEALLKPFDQPDRLLELSSFLYYYFFDLQRYPVLYEMLSKQGIEFNGSRPNDLACF